MLTVHRGVLTGLVAQLLVLTGLAVTVGLSPTGAVAGSVYGAVAVGLLARALVRSGMPAPGPADLVTLVRSSLVGGVAALVVDAFAGPVAVGALTVVAAAALALDGVDGRVARRTRTVSAVGARFDMEVDSVLVLLLSVYVARSLGPWVLALGCAHYALVVARRAVPWLRGQVPPRYWCKVVAVVQCMALTTVATGVLPRVVAVLALVLVAALLAESFGREVWWLWRHRAGVGSDLEPRAVGAVHA